MELLVCTQVQEPWGREPWGRARRFERVQQECLQPFLPSLVLGPGQLVINGPRRMKAPLC